LVKHFEVSSFDNNLALEMGLKIIEIAKKEDKLIAVSIDRLNHNIFKFVSEGLPADKHDWLRRKANVVARFEESSLSVKNDLANGNMTLEETFGLSEKDYVAKGGSIPIKVVNAGMVAIVTVSGLSDIEDHDLIVEALIPYVQSDSSL
jgi:uncharacterized protein (UPF0303 family)